MSHASSATEGRTKATRGPGLPAALQRAGRTSVQSEHGRLAYFGGCDYFRLSTHPKVLKAFRSAIARDGLSVSASRTTTGNHEVYLRLESELAAFFDVESAILLPNGYAANLAAAQALGGDVTTTYLDEQGHASLKDAAQLLGARIVFFKHRDPADLARALRRKGGTNRALLMTDGMFARTGAIAPLREYLQVLPRDSILWLDGAHSAGLFKSPGEGTGELAGVAPGRVIQTITLSKAFGAYGGAVLADRSFIQKVIERSRCFMGSTPIPLPCAEAARTALRLLRGDPEMRQRLWRHTAWLRNSLFGKGMAVDQRGGPILAFQPRGPDDLNFVQGQLAAARIHAPLIRYGSPDDHLFFRFVISSEHSSRQLGRLARVLHACQSRLTPLT